MNVLKAYAHHVVAYHPAKLRDEMFEELYDNLCEEYADWREAHPEGSEAGFLDAEKEHPIRYATRLAPDGAACLIGPRFYYSFVSALKVGATVTAAIYVAIAGVLAFASGDWVGSAIRMAAAYPGTLLWVSAAILGVFVALERSGEQASWLDRWKAADLSPADDHRAVSRGDAIFDLVLSTVGLMLVFGVVELPPVVRHDDAWVGGWGLAVPHALVWAAGALFAIDIAFAVFRLTRSLWTRGMRWLTIALNLAWLGVLGYAATFDPLLALEPASADLADVAALFDRIARGVLAVICLVLVVDTAKHGWRLLRDRTRP